MLRYTILGSGSTGNATLVEAHEHGLASRRTRVLVDCGLPLRELTRRLALRGVAIDTLDAVFITHEHADHLGCVDSLVRRHGVTVWTSAGTWEAGARRTAALQRPTSFARHGASIAVGAVELQPFSVPHDAKEPLQLVLSDGNRRLGIATDLGEPAVSVSDALSGCDALIIESNHDEAMLEAGPYPAFLKRRIGGHRGHLANSQAMALLAACAHPRLRRAVAAHLSRHNNTPDLAAAGFAQVLGCEPEDIDVAHAIEGTPWFDA